ncbi:MAG: YcfL family protein [Sedimentisphaerales bacterium]|nr:YcfL family protein [Sedimentisphaerales bacterium]
MKSLIILCVMLMLFGVGCGPKSSDERVHLRSGLSGGSLGHNVVTESIKGVFEWLSGAGIVIDEAVMNRDNAAGLPQLFIAGHNTSSKTKRFRYRVEWLDADGLVIDTRASTWLPMSAMGKSPFQIKSVATRPQAVNFRMDTRKWE